MSFNLKMKECNVFWKCVYNGDNFGTPLHFYLICTVSVSASSCTIHDMRWRDLFNCHSVQNWNIYEKNIKEILLSASIHYKVRKSIMLLYVGWSAIRECVRAGAAGARTRRALGHHLLLPLILGLIVLCAPAVLRPRALQDAPAPGDPNS